MSIMCQRAFTAHLYCDSNVILGCLTNLAQFLNKSFEIEIEYETPFLDLYFLELRDEVFRFKY